MTDEIISRLIAIRELEQCTDENGCSYGACGNCGYPIYSIDDLCEFDENIYYCPECYFGIYLF